MLRPPAFPCAGAARGAAAGGAANALRRAAPAQGLLEALQQGDDALFASHLAEYDSIARLDGWKTKILLQVGLRAEIWGGGVMFFPGGEFT